jgi:glycosyltransferase 2 family protein
MASRGVSFPGTWRWLRLLISVGLLGVLLSHIEIGRTLSTLGDAQLGFLALTFALVISDRLLAAYRWYVLLHGLSPGNTYWIVLRLSLVSSFVGTFMPGGVDLVRIYGLTRATSDLPLAFTSVLVERLQSIMALVCLMLAGVAASPVALPDRVMHLAWLALLLLTIAIAAIMHPRPRRLAQRLLPGRWLALIRAYLARIYDCLDSYRDRPILLAWSMALSLGFQLFRVVTVLVAAWALGLEIPILLLVALMPVVFFLTLLPISVAGGLGVREMGFVFLLGMAGIDAEASFALALLLSIGAIITAVPGAWFYARTGVMQR